MVWLIPFSSTILSPTDTISIACGRESSELSSEQVANCLLWRTLRSALPMYQNEMGESQGGLCHYWWVSDDIFEWLPMGEKYPFRKTKIGTLEWDSPFYFLERLMCTIFLIHPHFQSIICPCFIHSYCCSLAFIYSYCHFIFIVAELVGFYCFQ